MLRVSTIEDRISEVQAQVCKPLLSFEKYTTKGGATVLYGDKGYIFHKGPTVTEKIDAWEKLMRCHCLEIQNRGVAGLEPGTIRTMLSCSQAPKSRMFVCPKGLGKPPTFPGRDKDLYV